MRLKSRKHPLIIEGVRIPSQYMVGIHRKVSKGYVYYSFRLTGKRIDVSTVEKFYESLKTAKSATPVIKYTVRHLVEDYYQSHFFKGTSISTQKSYRYYLAPVLEVFGDLEAKALNSPNIVAKVIALRNALSDTPAKASHTVKTFALIADFGVESQKININHLKNIKTHYKSVSRADKIFSDEELKLVLDASEKLSKPYLFNIITLAILTAQRQGDLMNMKWSDIKGDEIVIIQAKKKKKVFIPIKGKLKSFLDSLERKDEYILGYRKTFPYAIYVGMLASLNLKAEDYNFHDLRGTSITRMLEKGATKQAVEMIAGNSSVIEKYTSRSSKLINDFDIDDMFNFVQPIVQI